MLRFRPPVLLLALVLCLAACSSTKDPVTPTVEIPTTPYDPAALGLSDGELCRDLAVFPQDLMPYAEKAGKDRELLPRERQEEENLSFDRKFFAAWNTQTPSLSMREAMEGIRNINPAKGYAENLRPFPRARWDELVKNCAVELYAAKGAVRHGITVENTDLRRMPTNLPFYFKPSRPGEGYPFDYFQASSLWMGTPLTITHVSRDAMWVYVETNIVAGWLPAASVAVVDETFKREWASRKLGAIIRDNALMSTLDATDLVTAVRRVFRVGVGTVLPLAGVGRKASETTVLVPVRDERGKALIRVGVLEQESVAAKPLPITPGNMALVGNTMMGQPYGWGGLYGQRDCSALTKDLFIPFGIWMPRNSRRQNTHGTILDVRGLSPDEKDQLIAEGGTPFLSLVAMPGHVAVYLGTYPGLDGREVPVMFHNLWGLRTRPAPGSHPDAPDGRAIIGKAVVTTLRPGAEQPLISSPASLLGRISGLSTMPGRRR